MNSLWIDSIEKKQFPQLEESLTTDACIIGAGIFGLTCAYHLTKLGFRVCVIEKDEIGEKASGHTTAKITSQHGLFYDYLITQYGFSFAKGYLEANEQAIEEIATIVQKEHIKCDFERENSYIYTTKDSEITQIQKEVEAVQSLGLSCDFVTKVGLPFPIKGSICFKNQAQFHPLKYQYGLCDCILKNGGQIFTQTPGIDINKDVDCYVTKTPNYEIKSKFVIVATHYPFLKIPGFYFAKMYQSTSYLIAIDPKKSLFSGMFINPASPIFSFRTAKYEGKKLLLIGGGDHKTGHPTCYQDSYGLLEQEAKKWYPNCDILFHWNTRDCISLDKIPYIGEFSSFLPHVYVSTGFKKWGMTSSQVAANIIVDHICGKTNPYSSIFSSKRVNPIKNRDELKNMMVQSANSLVFDKWKKANMEFEEIANDSGSIISIHGEKVGIYKDSTGNIFAVKPVCTHLGCLLSWNDVDKTWDCPCHGSRFDYKGKNLYDPAIKDLETYHIGIE